MGTSNGEQAKGLESKWWYRLLRVILLPLYGLVLLVALWLIYNGDHPRNLVDAQRSLIVCDDGKTYPVAAVWAPDTLVPDDPWRNPLTHIGDQLRSWRNRAFREDDILSTGAVPIPGGAIIGGDDSAARNWCSYGQASIPSEGLVTVHISDEGEITGVPIASTKGGRLDPDLMARYQRWLISHLVQVPAPPKGYVRIDPRTGERIADETLQFQALHSYTLKAAFNTEGSWGTMLWYMAIAWLVIHLAFVAVRGAVLYVAVGTFLPVRGLRGWLLL